MPHVGVPGSEALAGSAPSGGTGGGRGPSGGPKPCAADDIRDCRGPGGAGAWGFSPARIWRISWRVGAVTGVPVG